ncbi:HPr family phosphocarrier protein [bacterium endosymbiont of Pedicinus badii]|uniref:HPr family phosphocarrier protein n=1 Tax=bacterium endosymbiont of Pedicinus badii TaxID=1719126 RepID=UPI0009BAC4C5|nr:HPr family phosphocarrier protein [bacterium endosymbiont of Pedicinus badii]OQM34472.1 hypothetical protein AOQ89_01115 [bacterium endosymbiont of Pedicinus badii]
MYIKTVSINISNGIHARPAAKFVKLAKSFFSEIKIIANNQEENAKSILGIQSLGITKGTEIKICANGTDEKKAVNSLIELIKKLK